MGKFVKGDIVVTPFPFSDLSANKKRPALIVAKIEKGNLNWNDYDMIFPVTDLYENRIM